MPLTRLQSEILRTVARNRAPDSYVGGGGVLNADGSRYSSDIDFFSDGEASLARAVEADTVALQGAGFTLDWVARGQTFFRATVAQGASATRLDWGIDSDYRYFPTRPDARFGFTLDLIDLATNKLLAAADRNEVRDAIDLQLIDRDILALGPVAWAAAEKSPGRSPDGLLSEIRARARFRQEDIDQERTTQKLGAPDLNTWLRAACDRATAWIGTVPPEFEFGLFVDPKGKPSSPDFVTQGRGQWRIHKGSRGGAWPTSSEIASAMIHDRTRRTPPTDTSR